MQSIVELGKTAARAGCSVIFDEPMANHTLSLIHIWHLVRAEIF